MFIRHDIYILFNDSHYRCCEQHSVVVTLKAGEKMGFLSDWITKIILFMLIGTVVELILQSKMMKKYVHFILGLLFLLLLAQPIFFMFNIDITEKITDIERQLEQDSKN